ncbi:MAG: thiaminase II [Campylobacteraceae bacterium]|jgi:thiaminase/transcriptional activator TenA|nr:thiaminase II [Campylobacteraceae bacterium]
MSFSRSLKEKTKAVWDDCYNHPFVQEIGKGTLNKDVFMFYLKQDYKYLLEYARIYALGASKARDEQTIKKFTSSQKLILEEMNLHRSYMQSYGISDEEADKTLPSLFNRAYTSNMMATAYNGGLLELLAVLLPCPWTYYDFGCRLKEDFKDNLENNYYKKWIETYASKEVGEFFEWFFPLMDKLCEGKSEEELEVIVEIFKSSVEFEYLFWDMAYKKQMSY